jgi:hypothetical protein
MDAIVFDGLRIGIDAVFGVAIGADAAAAAAAMVELAMDGFEYGFCGLRVLGRSLIYFDGGLRF